MKEAKKTRKSETAESLRQKAKELMKRAQDLEDQKLIELGKFVRGLQEQGFKDFELTTFKENIKSILEG